MACPADNHACTEGFYEYEHEGGIKSFHYYGGASSDTEALKGLLFKRIEAVCGSSFTVEQLQIKKEVTTGGNPPWEAFARVRCGNT